MKKNIEVPKEFEKYFWDVDTAELKIKRHKNFILERMLNYGSSSSFSWIFKTFKKEDVKKLLDGKGKKSLARNSFLFWQKIVQEGDLWKRS
jgi:hypothetical protein